MLHPLALDALLRLTAGLDADGFRDWLIAFFDRLAELDRLARRETRRPCAQDDLERLDLPLDCGNGTFLYRPSTGGMNWLRTKAAEWWGGDIRRYTLALAYVCAHREKRPLEAVLRKDAAWATISKWAEDTGVPEESLRRAAIALLPPPDDSIKWFSMPGDGEGDGEPPDLSAIATAIVGKYGGTIEHWLWEASNDDFWGAWCGLLDKAEANDIKHENPDSWWRRHRRALLNCENALQEDTNDWLAKRNKDAAKESPEG